MTITSSTLHYSKCTKSVKRKCEGVNLLHIIPKRFKKVQKTYSSLTLGYFNISKFTLIMNVYL